jgi:uncharacterized RDD family membrane protein YckC
VRWLWYIGPLLAVLCYLAVVLGSTGEDEQRKRHLARFIDELLGPLKEGKKQLGRRVRALPDELLELVTAAGGGARIADVVLVPQLAYFASRAADGETLSAQHTVVFKLKKRAPSFVCRPLPIVDGRPVENRGLEIDADFGALFIVDGERGDQKAIRAWLDDDVREALTDLPAVWLRTDGTRAALTLYGPIDAESMEELVATADVLFAAYGSGSQSLLGDAKARAKKSPPAPSDVVPGEIASSELRIQAGAIDFALYAAAAFALALVNGSIAAFHPLVLFNSPDVIVDAPWQGGFTTKGMGAFTAGLGALVGLFAYQAYLGAHGRSIGKWLVGLEVVRTDGSPVDFFRGVLLRSWLAGAAVLAAAAAQTRPFSNGAWLAKILSSGSLTVGALAVAAGVATLTRHIEHRGLHDRLAGTMVVEAERVRVPSLQLATTRGMDPVVFGQLVRALSVAGLLVVALMICSAWDLKVERVPHEAVPLLIFVPLLAWRLAVGLRARA